MRSLLSRIFNTQPTVLLGRWARKNAEQQLQADVHDPGYHQMHWSVYPPGPARQEAIRRHYDELEKRLQR